MTFVIFLFILYFNDVVFSLHLSIKPSGFHNRILNRFPVGHTIETSPSTPPRSKRYTRWGGDSVANSEFLVQILDEDHTETATQVEPAPTTIIPYDDRPGKLQLGSVQMPAKTTEKSGTSDPPTYTRFRPLKPTTDTTDITFPRLLLLKKLNHGHHQRANHPPHGPHGPHGAHGAHGRLAPQQTPSEPPIFTKAVGDWGSIFINSPNKDSNSDVDITINVKEPEMEEGADDVIKEAVPSHGRHDNLTSAGVQSYSGANENEPKIKPSTKKKQIKKNHTRSTTKCSKRPVDPYESIYGDGIYKMGIHEINDNGVKYNSIDTVENNVIDGEENSDIGGGENSGSDSENNGSDGRGNPGSDGREYNGSDGRDNSGSDGRENNGPDGRENNGPDVRENNVSDGPEKSSIHDIQNDESNIYDYIETTKKHKLKTHTINPNYIMATHRAAHHSKSTLNRGTEGATKKQNSIKCTHRATHHSKSTLNRGIEGATKQPSKQDKRTTNTINDEIKPFTFASHHELAEIMTQLKKWCSDNPLAKCVDVTNGTLTYLQNPVMMIIVDDRSHGQDTSAKQTVVVVAGIQGRDHDAVSSAMYLLYELLERSQHHADLLGQYRFWVIPVFNPDGYEYSTSFADTRNWTKNMKQSWEACKNNNASLCGLDNCMGVNLDRNFEYQWTADSCRYRFRRADPCSDLYPGEKQLTEPETISLTSYLNKSPVPIRTFIAIKEGEILGILYPYSHTKNRRDTDAIHRKRASRAGYAAHSIAGRPFVSGQVSEFLPLYAGGIEDWMEGHLGVDNSYTIMLSRLNDTSVTIEQVGWESFAAIDTLLLTAEPQVIPVERLLRLSSAAQDTFHSRPWATFKPMDSFGAILQMSLYYFEFRIICTILYWLTNFETIP